MKRKIKEWISVQIAKNPGKMILLGILLFNIVFFLISAVIISNLSLTGTEKMGFFEAVFCTVTMILDAGCISYVIEDIGTAGVAVAVICLAIVFIGMISFTGAVIGYITNYISGFIENTNSGNKRLVISDHTVILNWNTRASEIINDLLYCKNEQKVVVLVNSRKTEIEKEIEERLEDTIARENKKIRKQYQNLNFISRFFAYREHKFTRNVTVIVREGDVFSSKQLHDISLEHAKSVVILGNDINNTVCKFEQKEITDERSRGNSQTVKTLMQVADITAADYSDDKQKIIVEITDDWTWELVDRIIRYKQVKGKCNIVPVRVNKILGQILSQFSIMPELNLAYKELFSNKGATFYTVDHEPVDDDSYIRSYLSNHKNAIPLTVIDEDGESYACYSSASESDIKKTDSVEKSDYTVALNEDYDTGHKNVIILGHNSKCHDIMRGFEAYRSEWNYKDGKDEVLRLVIIDDEKNLEKMNYEQYPFVTETIKASIYENTLRQQIKNTIDKFLATSGEDISVLILSDDSALNEDIDASALANLVYVQDIVREKKEQYGDAFDVERIDIIVEIINPKHHDIVSSYSVNNVVISNRYISKMITQIGEKEALYNFYTDILTYDTDPTEDGFTSKEIYAKKVVDYFKHIPEDCTAAELIRAVYAASTDKSLPTDMRNPTIVLGYVKPGGKMILFEGDQSDIKVHLDKRDKIIVFSNH